MKNQLNFLPDIRIHKNGPITELCLDAKLHHFKRACHSVHKLPYGTLSNQQKWQATLQEKRGTSSTKHAFIKALADELSIECELKLCVYAMTEQNTPGVGAVLDKYRMQSILEAGSYLQFGQHSCNFTHYFCDTTYIEPIMSYVHEEPVDCLNIADQTIRMHKKIMAERFGLERLDRLWHIHQQCIAAIRH